MELTFFQDFLVHFSLKESKSSITQGRGTRFWQLARKDIPSFEKTSASFKKQKKEWYNNVSATEIVWMFKPISILLEKIDCTKPKNQMI